MKVFILIHKKHAHVVGVYSNKKTCEEAQIVLNTMFMNKTYAIIEKNIIWKE